jgi:integrase
LELDAETVKEIPEYLSTFHYAAVEHAVLGLLWESGMRLGAAHELDVDDVDRPEEQLHLVHGPDEGTTLKNGPSVRRAD